MGFEVVKVGAGALFLTNTSTFAGPTLVGGGNLVLSNGSGLALIEETGTARAELAADETGAGRALAAAHGKPRARLRVVKGGPAVALFDEKGKVLRSLP